VVVQEDLKIFQLTMGLLEGLVEVALFLATEEQEVQGPQGKEITEEPGPLLQIMVAGVVAVLGP
jgi:hypothetical protein